MRIKVQRKLFLHPSGLTMGSLMLLHQEVRVSIPEEGGIMRIKVQRKLFLHPNGLTMGSLMLLHQEVRVLIPEEGGIMLIKGEMLTRDLHHDTRSTVKHGSHRAA